MFAAVLQEGRREGRIVGIVATKKHIGRDRFCHLHETAVVAKGELQGEARLGLSQLALFQKGIGERLGPEVEKDCQACAQAGPTAGQSAWAPWKCAHHDAFQKWYSWLNCSPALDLDQ